MKNRFFKYKLLFLVMTVLLLLGLAGCGKGGSKMEVVSAIDMTSVTQDGEITTFTATDLSGRSIRFRGIGIEVTDEGIVMQPFAKLLFLDYIGQIYDITVKSNLKDDTDYWMLFGIGYADSPSVSTLAELNVAIPWSNSVGEKMDVSDYNTGFVVLEAGEENPSAITVKELNISYDAGKDQMFTADIDSLANAAELLQTHFVDLEAPHNLTMNSIDQILERKLANPSVISSDIISGIDHSSVVKDGNTTFFTSVMSDGTAVRFEGYNIDIGTNGITIHADSEITSLDAIGKIYAYYPYMNNYASYPQETLAMLDCGYGYTYSALKTSVDRAYEVHTYSISGSVAPEMNGEIPMNVAAFEPNFVYLSGYNYMTSTGEIEYAGETFTVNSINVYYDPTEKVTAMREAKFEIEFTGFYLEDEIYDSGMEESKDPYENNLAYYLVVVPDTEGGQIYDTSGSVWCLPSAFYDVGAMRDENGNEIDKSTPLKDGYTLDLHLGDFTMPVKVPVTERYEGAYTMNDLVPYAYPEAVGQLNTLVIPVIWADQTHMANDETLDLFRKGIGRIVDTNGNVTDYSATDDEKFSLSEYYDIASYGKLEISSFMTDWYYSKENFSDVWASSASDNYADDIMEWVLSTYPDMDWSKYDKDGNGYIDSMIVLNAGIPENTDMYVQGSHTGAVNYRRTYYGDFAGTQDAPRVNNFTTVGYNMIKNDYSAIMHEFAHGLGLVDYYDVTYSGIDAVGNLDLQSSGAGDWNAYSKLAVGWMEPTIVDNLASGESVEYTIGSSALENDVIIIPATGTDYDGPFGEYVMIDLLTMDGVNRYGTEQFGLAGIDGIRISHVNASMVQHTETITSAINPDMNGEYTIGTIRYGNEYKDSEKAKYNIEVIQAGGNNTFTDPDSTDKMLAADDLFYAGDSFRAENYNEFFYNGLMDYGQEFGYTVEIVSIGNDANGQPQANVRITAD